jgi:diguanylate cyclase
MNDAGASAPSAIARETLKQLAQRRLPPTPDHYATLYSEIAGADTSGYTRAPKLLAELATAFGAGEGPVSRAAGQLARSVAAGNWDDAATALDAMVRAIEEFTGADWGALIRDLVAAVDARHAGVTTARKRESVSHVLGVFGRDPLKLHGKLAALIRSWAEPVAAGDPAPPAQEAAPVTAAIGAAVPPAVAQAAAGPTTLEAEDNRPREDVSRELADLIALLIDNVGELVADDRWLVGQVTRIRDLMSGPINPIVVRAAKRAVRDLILRQGVLSHSLAQTRTALKEMITTFIDRLGRMVDTTSGFNQEMEALAREIESTNDFAQLGRLVNQVMQKTRGIQADFIRTRDALLAEHARSLEHAAKVRQLEDELESLSQRVNEDALTAALNRRGLDQAFAIETGRAVREGRALTLALLDVDNFKALNDRLGHSAGDAALKHLVEAVRDAVRPTDVVARFGGEEFVILLPDADVDAAGAVMKRVQRSLTRRFFLHNNEKVLITFSAGLALWREGETQEQVMGRADAALYRAKQAGKNRVMAAEQIS